MNQFIQTLKNRQLVWHGQLQKNSATQLDSGYPVLNDALGGGLPSQGVTELISPVGVGELALSLAWCKERDWQRKIVLIAPPSVPYGPYFHSQGVAIERLLVIRPNQAQQALWAAEQCLASGCCQTVMLWHDNALSIKHVKRLKAAASQGASQVIIFRTCKHESLSLPLDLSMTLTPKDQQLEVTINKLKGHWHRPSVTLLVQANLLEPFSTVAVNNVVPFQRPSTIQHR